MRPCYVKLVAVLCLTGLISGCVMSEKYSAYRTEVDDRPFFRQQFDTWHDWFTDLADVASAELATGEGIGFNVQPTKLFTAGLMFEDVLKVGWRKRGCGFYREVRKEGGLTWFYYRDALYEPKIGTPGIFEREPLKRGFIIRDNDDRHWMDIGMEGHLIFFGAGAFVSPKEALDFLGNTVTLPYNLFIRPMLNWTGVRPPEFDLADDDTLAQIRRKHDLELIRAGKMFEPAEVLNELMDVGY